MDWGAIAAMRLRDCHNIHDFRRLARRRLPAPIFNYIDGAADDEVTHQRNTESFADCDLVPNVLHGVEKNSDPTLAEEVARYVPYYLDLGYFMSRSIAIVANLDDPIDTGMVVEIAYSTICNIPVIGVRTDLRSPLGNVEDVIGINPFPVEQCDCYIKAYPPTGNYDDVFKKTDFIIRKVDEKLKEWIPKKKNNMTENDNPIFKNLVKGAEILFSDIDDIHTQDNMIKIAQRFAGNKEFLLSIAPELVSITSEEE